jgi:hypothetical protein
MPQIMYIVKQLLLLAQDVWLLWMRSAIWQQKSNS